jgi:cholesterol oxidase
MAASRLREEHYDAIVVGSGFGGAVAACRLAQAGVSVAILERGRRYGPGESFSSSPSSSSSRQA